jgi:hypothetical protein
VTRVGTVSHAAVVVTLGLCLAGCGELGEALDGSIVGRDCHPDPTTVAALRREPVMIQAPPGAALGTVTETVSCGWENGPFPEDGRLDLDVARAGATDDVARFYAGLAHSSGWTESDQSGKDFDQGDEVYSAGKPDGTECDWTFQVRGVATGSYHLRIEYTPRDVRPSCI